MGFAPRRCTRTGKWRGMCSRRPQSFGAEESVCPSLPLRPTQWRTDVKSVWTPVVTRTFQSRLCGRICTRRLHKRRSEERLILPHRCRELPHVRDAMRGLQKSSGDMLDHYAST